MEIRNRGKNTINVTLRKSYEGFGKTLIMKRNEIRDISIEMYEEPEVEKYRKKGIIVNVVRREDKIDILSAVGAVESNSKKVKKINKQVDEEVL